MESAKEEAHETSLSSEQEDQDAESEIEQMSSSELSLSVLSGLLEFEVVQHYDKLRKLELTLMDQVINLNLDEGEFHEEAIVSLQKRISMIQVMLKLLKQTLAHETKFETSKPECSDIRSRVGPSGVPGNLRIPGRRMTKLEEKEATSSTESESDYHMMKREQSASDHSSSSGSDSRRQARIPRGVANPSVGLFESSTGSGDWLKKLDNLPKLKTSTKDIVKVLEFQFSFKILIKAKGLQEGVLGCHSWFC